MATAFSLSASIRTTTTSREVKRTSAPSGIDFASSLPATAIRSLDGIPAVDRGLPRVDDSGADIQLSLLGQTSNIGAAGGTVALVNSPDAAYRRHSLTIPSGALTGTLSFALRPPAQNLGVIGAVQIQSSLPTVTFAANAVAQLEYRDGDIDRERGQREREMRVHQLVENPRGVFQYRAVQGTQTLNPPARTVSVPLGSLNPGGTLGGTTVFAGLPIETVDERMVNIKQGGGAGIRRGDGAVVLAPGPRGSYTLHAIQFPGYVETGTTDSERLVVKIRTAAQTERSSRSGGRSFPAQSDAIFTVTVTDASSQPARFTAPVNVTVQFKERPDPTQTDVVYFDGRQATPWILRLVRDRLAGEDVDFGFDSARSQTVNTMQGTVTVQNVVGLTGSDGCGTFGVVGAPETVTTPRWRLYR